MMQDDSQKRHKVTESGPLDVDDIVLTGAPAAFAQKRKFPISCPNPECYQEFNSSDVQQLLVDSLDMVEVC